MIYQIGWGLWPKPDRIMTLPIIQVWTTLKMNLSYHDQLDQVRSMKRTRKDNDLTNRIGMIYTEKENWVVVTPWTRCDLWRKPNKTMMWRFACLVYDKMILNFQDLLNRVRSMKKKDWIMKKLIVHVQSMEKNESALSWSIGPSEVCHENQTRQLHERLYRCSLHRKWN